MIEQIGTVLSLVAAILLIIILAYYTTIIIGKKANYFSSSRRMQVLERLSVGVGMHIIVVKINAKIYILSTGGKNIEVIDIIEEVEWGNTIVDPLDNKYKVEGKEKFFPSKFKTIVDKKVGEFFKKGYENDDGSSK